MIQLDFGMMIYTLYRRLRREEISRKIIDRLDAIQVGIPMWRSGSILAVDPLLGALGAPAVPTQQ